MKGTKLIGIGLATLAICIGARADVAADMEAARAAYYSISGDVAKAAQVQAMFEAIKDSPSARNMVGHCLRMQGKYEEAIAAYQSTLELESNQSNILNIQGGIAEARYSMSQYQAGVDGLKAAMDANPKAADACKSSALNVYAKGLSLLGKHAEASQALIERIILRVTSTRVADETVMKSFMSIRPDAMTVEAYKTALSDILKATPATEANAEFLGRVKSELEKMK